MGGRGEGFGNVSFAQPPHAPPTHPHEWMIDPHIFVRTEKTKNTYQKLVSHQVSFSSICYPHFLLLYLF